MRLVLTFLAFLLPGVAFAQCVPSQATKGMVGCQPIAPSIAGTDFIEVWLPGAWPNSLQIVPVDTLFQGRTPDLASPGPIGSVAPSTGAFTTIIGNAAAAVVNMIGNTYNRTLQDIFSDTINPLFYGGSQQVDRTGALNTSAAFQAAAVAACSFTPPRGLSVPAGIYGFASVVTIPCSDVSISAAVHGTATFRILPGNVSAPAIFLVNGLDRPKFQGLRCDAAPAATNSNGCIQINGPSIAPEYDDNVFTNMAGNGIWNVPGPSIIAGFLSTDVAQGDTTMTLTTLDTKVHKGAYFLNAFDPDIYLAAEPSGTTITINKPNTESALKNTRINVTAAFTITADVLQGSVLPVAHTDGLVAKQTIYSPFAPCVTRGTRIASFITDTSVTLEKPITCPVRSGTSFAAALGISSLRATNNKFLDLGQALATGNPVVYTTATLTSSGTNTMTLACVSGIKCAAVGLIPYNTTGTTGLPNGVPALNPVVDQTAINNTAGIYTVQFAQNFTADIPAGTPIPFLIAQNSGKGYGFWSANGAWFANTDYMFSGNLSKHTWSASYFIWYTWGTTIDGDVFSEDFQEFRSPTVAPSPCINASVNVDLTIKNITCRGATGFGLELDRNIHFILSNVHLSYNGTAGAYVCGGHDVQIVNFTSYNNGQWNNYPKVSQSSPDVSAGLQLSGSCTFSRTGVLANLVLDDLNLFDDQVSINGTPTPTQSYGVWQWDHAAILNNVVLGQYSVTGNKVAQFDPNLGFNPPPLGQDNRIINPCGTIDQSNQGASLVTPTNGYSSDQWQALANPARVSYQRTVTVMGGCPNSIKATVVTSASPAATAFSYIQQQIEASFVSDFKFGTASARNVIVDFCASATTAGTYGWGMKNNFGGHLRGYASAITISAPNTPQCYSSVVPGDTVAGFSGLPGAAGLGILFDTGSGSNFQTGTCNAWADITATTAFFCNTATPLVTLAIGQSINFSAVRIYPADVDSTWVQRTADAEQALAQRYFLMTFQGIVPAQNAGLIGALCTQSPLPAGGIQNRQWIFPVAMRQAPTLVTFNPSAANDNWRDTTAGSDVTVTINPDGSEDALQVLIQAAFTPANDISCIHATASARY